VNKKRFLVFSSVILLFITTIIVIALLVFRSPDPVTSLITVEGEADVNQFYYRTVPGLQMAETANLVTSVNKRLELSGRDAALNIDRIWYNNRSIIIFYHVEGVSQEVYLGGELYLPSNEPAVKTAFHGLDAIGNPDEKGILYNKAFYSCLKLPLLRDNAGKVIDEVETVTYTPFITIPGKGEKATSETIQLKSFEIALNYSSEAETIIKNPVDSQMELGPERMYFYQIDQSPSIVSLYFQYLNSGRDKVYRVKGSYTTDRGETCRFDSQAVAITDYPYHYTIEVPPFNSRPERLKLTIDSIYIRGGDKAAFTVDTSLYTGKKRIFNTNIGEDRIKGTDISISEIKLDSDTVELFVAYEQKEELIEPYKMLQPLIPTWYSAGQSPEEKPANLLTIKNASLEHYDLDHLVHGATLHLGQGLGIQISRAFWDDAGKVFLELKNLTYIHQVQRDITIKIDWEE